MKALLGVLFFSIVSTAVSADTCYVRFTSHYSNTSTTTEWTEQNSAIDTVEACMIEAKDRLISVGEYSITKAEYKFQSGIQEYFGSIQVH